jgi:hypothetical protein
MISFCAEVAQSVEQRTENPRVGGSIPSLGTPKNNKLQTLITRLCFSKTPLRHHHIPPITFHF